MHQTISKSHAIKIYDPVLKWDIFPKLVRVTLLSIAIFITVFSFNWYYVDTGRLLDFVVVQTLEDKVFPRSKENYLISKDYTTDEKKSYDLDNFHRVRFVSISSDSALKNDDKPKKYFSKINEPTFQVSQQKLRKPKLIKKVISVLPKNSNLQQCEQHLNANRLTTGKPGNALDCYKRILLLDPTNVKAKVGLTEIERRYKNWAKTAINKGNFKKARGYIKRLRKVNPKSATLSKLKRLLIHSQTLVKKTPKPQHKLPPSSKKKVTKRSSHNTTKKVSKKVSNKGANKVSKRCGDIFSQESLGVRTLTDGQKRFKGKYCE
ncbi:tetratricopeptide repeat protein [Thiotrichales bacterium HSG1]|nr:tetratricopeptide repeat protein [Thiotrichales bacterium HSG1]